jgi:hypothetical protein
MPAPAGLEAVTPDALVAPAAAYLLGPALVLHIE